MTGAPGSIHSDKESNPWAENPLKVLPLLVFLGLSFCAPTPYNSTVLS